MRKALKFSKPTEQTFLTFFFYFHSFCTEKWDGAALLMGTMYSFDIFAAMPCCTERLKVSNPLRVLSANILSLRRLLNNTKTYNSNSYSA